MNRSVIHSSARAIIYKVYVRCLAELEAGKFLSNLNDVYKRTAVMTEHQLWNILPVVGGELGFVGHSHTVVKLTTCHCDLNPIELIWGLVKHKIVSHTVGLVDIKIAQDRKVWKKQGEVFVQMWGTMLPKNPEHSAAWLTAVAKLGCRMNKYLVVCSEHFLPEDFDDTRHNQRRVKSGAVPTIVTMAPVIQDELKVCRVCLALDVKMYNMKDFRLSEMFQNITGITAINKKGSILQRVCWECAARLTAAAAFREKALLSEKLLKDQVHIKESDITSLKQNYSSLKSPLTVKTAVSSYDIECEHTNSENKGTKTLRNDETDNNDRKHELRVVIEEEKEMGFEQYESWIDVPVKTEIETDPIADNTMRFQDRKGYTFSEQTHFNDASPTEDNEDEMTNTEAQINNNDKILSEDTPKKVPYINDAGNIILVDKEKKIKPDVIGKIVDETSSDGDVLRTAVSGNKCKQEMISEDGPSNKKVRRMYLLNERIKEKIIELKNNGLSVAAISKETGMSTSSISCWWRRYRKSGNAYRRSITPGYQSGSRQNYFHNVEEPGKEMEPCPAIVRQRLLEAGLEHILMKKPERTVTMGQNTSTRKALHEDLKQRIIALKQEGMSNSRIAYLLNTARNTVQKWWTRWCNEGHMQNHKQPGRKRKTTPQEDQLLIERVSQEQTVHTPTLAKEFGISLKCLTNRLKEAGFKNKTREAYVPLKAGRSHKVDEEMKQQIISMKLNGVSVTDIANQFRVPRTTIYQWWQRWCKENNIKIKSDNNTTTTAEQDKSLPEHTAFERIVQTPSVTTSQMSLWQKMPHVEWKP